MPPTTQTTTTTQRNISGNNIPSSNSTLVTSTSLMTPTTMALVRDSPHCREFSQNTTRSVEINKSKQHYNLQNRLENDTASNDVQCLTGSSSNFISSTEKYVKIHENRNMNQGMLSSNLCSFS